MRFITAAIALLVAVAAPAAAEEYTSTTIFFKSTPVTTDPEAQQENPAGLVVHKAAGHFEVTGSAHKVNTLAVDRVNPSSSTILSGGDRVFLTSQIDYSLYNFNKLKSYYGYRYDAKDEKGNTNDPNTAPKTLGSFDYFASLTPPPANAGDVPAWVTALIPLHTNSPSAGTTLIETSSQTGDLTPFAKDQKTNKFGITTKYNTYEDINGDVQTNTEIPIGSVFDPVTNPAYWRTVTRFDVNPNAAVDTTFNSYAWPQQSTGPASPGGATALVYPFLVTRFTIAAEDTKKPFAVYNTLGAAGADNGAATGDPQFSGLQGQDYQFHGMADEVFNLVSTPELQMNSLFKFIASGNCEYNNTVCWSHPGTYLGQIAIQFGSEQILLQSAAHSKGMTVLVNGKALAPSAHVHRYHSGNSTMSLSFKSATGDLTISSDKLFFRIVNSDYFFNMDFGVKDASIIQAGTPKLTITGEICEVESHSVPKTLAGKVAEQVKATYPAIPMHGLLGQTWRNAVYCGRYFEGVVDDYVTGGLFSNEFTFNQFRL